MVGRRALRAFSYILVAVFAFGLGSSRPAFAETGGLPALTTQVQTLVTGLAAEVARAMGAETALGKRVDTLSASSANLTAGLAATNAGLADEARVRQLYEKANEEHQAAQDHALAAQDLWDQRQESLNTADEARQAAHELADAAQNLQQDTALRQLAADQRKQADALDVESAIRAIEDDKLKQNEAAERLRALAAEDRESAARELADAKQEEKEAADLERAAADLGVEAAARKQGDADTLATAIAATRLISIDQLVGLKCTTIDNRPGHVSVMVGADNSLTLTCVPDQ